MQKNPNHIDRPFDSNVIISEIIKSATLILLSKVGLLGRTFDRSRFWKYYFCKLPIEFIYTLCTIHYVFFVLWINTMLTVLCVATVLQCAVLS